MAAPVPKKLSVCMCKAMYEAFPRTLMEKNLCDNIVSTVDSQLISTHRGLVDAQ